MHPVIVRRVLLPLHEWALQRDSLRYLHRLEDSQWWPAERLRELQQAKLRRLLRYAHEHCPYYGKRIDDAGIDVDRVTLDKLSQLPTLTKSDIAEHTHLMIDHEIKGGLCDLTTGGSTGEPLAFKVDRTRQAADQAARARTRRWFGINVGQRELYLWGSPLEHAARDHIRHVRDILTNHRLLNAFKMTPARMSRYIDTIHRFDPVHIFGYPSSIARLVRHAADCGRPVRNRSLKAVFVTGELFHQADRAIIEEFAAVPVVDGYGSREAGFIAHQCPAGAYHITMESLIVELLDADGRPVSPGTPGEITITHLDAFGMPFIRYRTGDVARQASGQCPCGRRLDSLEIIEGRRTDMLRTAAGGFAHALSVIYVLRDEPTVGEFKIVQQRSLDLDVSVVPRGEFGPASRQRVCESLKRRIGEEIEVSISLTDRIHPDASGKHRHVVSEAV
ncbi:MAG: AMP-binding protein [Planctomycetota bacterium]